MRQVISISLPKEQLSYVKQQMKQAGFTSQSAYFRHLLELEASLIGEDEILELRKATRKAHQKRKTKKLNSLADLIA